MNYVEVYNSIIYDPRNNLLTKDHGIEFHHIHPRSLGGSDEHDNIVKLTYRQHFICHWLLTKIYKGEAKSKMICAFKFMIEGWQKKYNILNSFSYTMLRKDFSSDQSNRMMKNQYAKGHVVSEESRLIMKKKRAQQVITPKHKESIRIAQLGNQYGLGYIHTPDQNLAKGVRMKGKQNAKGCKHSVEANQEKGRISTLRWAKMTQKQRADLFDKRTQTRKRNALKCREINEN